MHVPPPAPGASPSVIRVLRHALYMSNFGYRRRPARSTAPGQQHPSPAGI